MFKSKKAKKLEQKLDFIDSYLNNCIRYKKKELETYEKNLGKDSILYKVARSELFELKFMKNTFENFENWD